MIDTMCGCGAAFQAPESSANSALRCSSCGTLIRPIAAEDLPPDAGAGDFDAHLVVEAGPALVGERILLGGVMPLEIGKLAGKSLMLPGTRVSRNHCRLERLDFGPSRWKIIDQSSTNGLFINDQRVSEHELQSGDLIGIGEFQLRYCSMFELPESAGVAVIAQGGPVCPSCQKSLAPGARICVGCGIYVDTGRPLVTTKALDEEELESRADTWIRTVSWIMRFGLFPIASEAMGTRKPTALWSIAGITVAASLIFFIGVHASEDGRGGPLSNFMLWWGVPFGEIDVPQALVREVEQVDLEYLTEADVEDMMARHDVGEVQMIAALEQAGVFEMPSGEFYPHQMLTHAMLHDPGERMPFAILPLIYHLGGNLVFMLVFGLAVNELIGNARTAIIYPLLAIGSAAVQMWSSIGDPRIPNLGASGAVMGLAGMYFILFPTQKVRMAIWFRGPFFMKFHLWYKLFAVRGFWLLIFWIIWNDVLPLVIFKALDIEQLGGTAHWAHLGGFLCGAAVALLLLFSRLVNARGSDIFSMMLGRRAWALVGKPSQPELAPPPPRAISMNFE